jgi:3-deoxy-D-manno-octulosonic-acid transferase
LSGSTGQHDAGVSSGIKPWFARQAYSLLLRAAVPFYLWRVWSRGREEPSYRHHWAQRLGFYGHAYRRAALAGAAPRLWLHAVSLGEARAAVPLVRALRAVHPEMHLVLTHSTATGREAGQALMLPGDTQTWLPFDTPGAVQRFLRVHKPSVGVLMETEVWPNLLHEARALGVPMVLANARLSDKSLRQGQRFAALLRPAAHALRATLAQTDDDARRLRAMGADPVTVCGNVKFDASPDATQLTLGRQWRAASDRPIVLAASTREGEEPGLLAAWCGDRAATNANAAMAGLGRPRLLLVPRHPQRFDEVARLVMQAGLSLSRRSTWPAGHPDALALQADVWLGDSMGEMPCYYAAACIALLGGSFMPLGGQNLIEAAACSCPIVMGPSTFNFDEAARLSESAGAARRVANWDEGVRVALVSCLDGHHVERASWAASFAQAHKGAAERMASVIWGAAAH